MGSHIRNPTRPNDNPSPTRAQCPPPQPGPDPATGASSPLLEIRSTSLVTAAWKRPSD